MSIKKKQIRYCSKGIFYEAHCERCVLHVFEKSFLIDEFKIDVVYFHKNYEINFQIFSNFKFSFFFFLERLSILLTNI
jgi:hypothetical protein